MERSMTRPLVAAYEALQDLEYGWSTWDPTSSVPGLHSSGWIGILRALGVPHVLVRSRARRLCSRTIIM